MTCTAGGLLRRQRDAGVRRHRGGGADARDDLERRCRPCGRARASSARPLNRLRVAVDAAGRRGRRRRAALAVRTTQLGPRWRGSAARRARRARRRRASTSGAAEAGDDVLAGDLVDDDDVGGGEEVQRAARVMSPGSPGPAPTKATRPGTGSAERRWWQWGSVETRGAHECTLRAACWVCGWCNVESGERMPSRLGLAAALGRARGTVAGGVGVGALLGTRRGRRRRPRAARRRAGGRGPRPASATGPTSERRRSAEPSGAPTNARSDSSRPVLALDDLGQRADRCGAAGLEGGEHARARR